MDLVRGWAAALGATLPPGAPHPGAHVSHASLVTSRKGCSRATAALFTSRSTGPTPPSARSVASQSPRSTHTGSTPGHCVHGAGVGGGQAQQSGCLPHKEAGLGAADLSDPQGQGEGSPGASHLLRAQNPRMLRKRGGGWLVSGPLRAWGPGASGLHSLLPSLLSPASGPGPARRPFLLPSKPRRRRHCLGGHSGAHGVCALGHPRPRRCPPPAGRGPAGRGPAAVPRGPGCPGRPGSGSPPPPAPPPRAAPGPCCARCLRGARLRGASASRPPRAPRPGRRPTFARPGDERPAAREPQLHGVANCGRGPEGPGLERGARRGQRGAGAGAGGGAPAGRLARRRGRGGGGGQGSRQARGQGFQTARWRRTRRERSRPAGPASLLLRRGPRHCQAGRGVNAVGAQASCFSFGF